MTLSPHTLQLPSVVDTSDPSYTKYPQCSLLLLLSWFQSLKFLMLLFLNYSHTFYLIFLNSSFHLATLPLTPQRSLPQTCWQEQMHLTPSQDPPLMDMAATVCFRPWTIRGVGTEAAVCPPLWWPPLSDPTTRIQTVHGKLNKLIRRQSKAQTSFHIWFLC